MNVEKLIFKCNKGACKDKPTVQEKSKEALPTDKTFIAGAFQNPYHYNMPHIVVQSH